jgi:hypothetical protein
MFSGWSPVFCFPSGALEKNDNALMTGAAPITEFVR